MADIVNSDLATSIGKDLPDVTLNLSKWEPKAPSGRSGHAPRGNYEMEIVSVRVTKKVSGAGENVEWVDRVVGPNSIGTTVITRHPAPSGAQDSKAVETAMGFFGQRMFAMASHSGKDPAAFRKNGVTVNADTFVGRKFYAYLEDGEGEYADTSELKAYITKAQYEAQPGPRAGAQQSQNGSGSGTASSILDNVKPAKSRAASLDL